MLTYLLLQVGDKSQWITLAKRGMEGQYNDQSVFLDILDAIMTVEDQYFKRKSLKNMKYDAQFDLICTNLALVSP